MSNPLSYLHDQLEQWRAEGTYQRLRILESASAAESRFDGKEVINLASNNYLGLTTHPKLREAAIEAVRKLRRRLRRRAHHLRHHDAPHGAGGAHRRLQERGGLRGLPVRLRRQRRNRLGHSRTRRPHHLRRAESRQHHRRLPPLARQDPRLPAQRRRRRGEDPRRTRWRPRPQAADHRRRLLHGRRYRPAARPGGSRRTARRHHDGGRRAFVRRARPRTAAAPSITSACTAACTSRSARSRKPSACSADTSAAAAI